MAENFINILAGTRCPSGNFNWQSDLTSYVGKQNSSGGGSFPKMQVGGQNLRNVGVKQNFFSSLLKKSPEFFLKKVNGLKFLPKNP